MNNKVIETTELAHYKSKFESRSPLIHYGAVSSSDGRRSVTLEHSLLTNYRLSRLDLVIIHALTICYIPH